IADAFSQNSSMISASPSGIMMNFAADPRQAPRTDASRRTDEAFSALAYAGGAINKAPPMGRTMAPPIERRWSAWLDVRGSGWDQSNAVDGNQINLTGGVGYKV